jgi:hypothetical protein
MNNVNFIQNFSICIFRVINEKPPGGKVYHLLVSNPRVNYTVKHSLKLNPQKTQSMIIRSWLAWSSHPKPLNRRRSQYQLRFNFLNIEKIRVNNIEIPYSAKIKNLGIIMDDFFTWTNQVSAICQKIYFSLHRVYKFRSITTHDTRVKLVSTLILPITDYCIVFFCNMSDENLNRLQVAQNNAVRYIFNIKRREHITAYYGKLGWLKVK